jgi:hypothetical protein
MPGDEGEVTCAWMMVAAMGSLTFASVVAIDLLVILLNIIFQRQSI